MKIFLLDLWHDLRAKRLWPVAVILLLGLVAVPVLLAQPAEEPAPAPAPPAAAKKPDREEFAALAQVKLGEEESSGSTLGEFDPSDPFKPPKGTIKKPDSGDPNGSGPGSDTGAPAGGDFGGGTDSTRDTGTTFSGGVTGGGTGDTTPGGDGDGGSDGRGDTTTTTQYAYVVDVTFRANERTRKLKGMERLDMLPSADSPLLLFLGVAAGGGNAVFLVDATLEAAGEGRCQPSAKDCAFLHIGPGSEHEFTNDEGDSYTLRVDEIRRVKLENKKASAAKKDRRTASAAVGRDAPARRFALPFLADLVSVSSGTDRNSNSDQDRR